MDPYERTKCPETTEEWKSYLAALLDASQYLVLATAGEGGLWANPVYFSFDDSFTLYFLSRPTSRHMRNIDSDQNVACAIFDPAQEAARKVRGAQIAGVGGWVGYGEARHAFDTYFRAKPGRAPVPPRGDALAHVNPTSDWRLAKLTPRSIECFDEYCFLGSKGRVPPEVFAVSA